MSNTTIDPIPSIITTLLNTLQSQGYKIIDHHLETNAIHAGYNFCSGIAKLKVNLKRSNGIREEKSFVFKIPSQCPFYEQLSALKMYQNEVLMYSHVLPAISELAECNWMATCYLLPDSDNLVFDDLNVQGYELMYKENQLDFAHSELAMRTLAKLHALSLKLWEISRQTVEVIKVPPRDPPKGNCRPSAVLQRFENTLAMLNLPEHVLLEVSHFVKYNAPAVFIETLAPSSYLNVLCHGDFWLGNMLFKHTQQDTIEDMKLLDFQMTHWCSPVIDLIKFFVTSIRIDVYLASRDKLIGIYLRTFNGFLESLNSSVRYRRSDLDRDMRQYKQYHLYCLGYYLSSVLNEEDPFDHGGIDVECYTRPLYKDTLLKWVKHLDKEHLL